MPPEWAVITRDVYTNIHVCNLLDPAVLVSIKKFYRKIS